MGISVSAACGVGHGSGPLTPTTTQVSPARESPVSCRSSSVADVIPNVSRTRSSTADTASCPATRLPDRVDSVSASARARAASRVRRAAMSTMTLTAVATTTNTPSARMFSVLRI